jgi:hypothetical protein
MLNEKWKFRSVFNVSHCIAFDLVYLLIQLYTENEIVFRYLNTLYK